MRAFVLLTVAAALLAGCGAAQEASTVDLDSVASKTGASSARIELDMAVEAQNEAALSEKEREELSYLTFHAAGAVAEHGRFYELTYLYPRRAFGLEGSGDIEFDAILDAKSGDMYVSYGPDLGLELPPGKRWVHMQDDSLQGANSANDPSQMVSYLRAASEGGLENLGQEQVRGVRTTRYAVVVSVERAEDVLGAQDESTKKSLEALREAGFDEIPMEVWIDGDDYARRVVLDWVLPGPDGTRGGTMKMKLEMWDFGADIEVAAPAESTVIEEEDLG